MSRKYNKLLRNTGLVLSQPQTRSTSHQKDIKLLHQDNICLHLLSGGQPSNSNIEECSSIEGSISGSTPHGTIKKQAAQIFSQIERNSTLMENDPLAEHLRVETLREMPQSLTLKRTVKAKLTRAVSNKNKTRPIGCCRRFKYWISIMLTRLKMQLNEILYGVELWYNSLKTIEGHFGSDVAAYFKFIRWLFILNFLVLFLSFSFIVLPQLLYMEVSETNGTAQIGDLFVSVPNSIINPASNSSTFYFSDIFTGEGFFTNSTLYYGFYINKNLSDAHFTYYSMPTAYFFTALTSYLFTFIVLSVSMARSYRKSFIETSGGVKNVYALKIFCAWDFSIATENAAELKSESILRDIKKLLEADLHGALHKPKFLQKFYLLCIRVCVNLVIFIMLAASGLLIYSLLDQSLMYFVDITAAYVTGYSLINSSCCLTEWQDEPVIISFIVTLILIVLPFIFSSIVRFEKYDTRVSLYITMLRTFALECIIVAVMVVFWLQKDNSECWETSLGQEVYRLIVMDFLLSGVTVTLIEFFRTGLKRTCFKQLDAYEFDISRNTLNLIYNEILFWVGFFFSPLLSLVIVVKMFFIFYLKKVSLLYNCVPSKCYWRAAQTETLFLVLSFISLLFILITNGYIITSVHTSDCGPFKGATYMYEKILEEVFHVQQGNAFWSFIMFLRKPGFVAGLLLSMCGAAYYLRAKSIAQKKMVKILREMLVTEAKDKEYLLTQISFFTGGRKSRPQSQID